MDPVQEAASDLEWTLMDMGVKAPEQRRLVVHRWLDRLRHASARLEQLAPRGPQAPPPRESQESVHRWIAETFPGADPQSPRMALRLLEEAIELCLASGAHPGQIGAALTRVIYDCGRKSEWYAGRGAKPDKITAEAADVQVVLYGIAGMRGFDLAREVDRKMEVNRSRRWEAFGDGTGQHIKDTEA